MDVVAHHDFESCAVADLRRCGAYRYAEDPETRVLMMSWRIGEGLVRRWHPGDPEPREFLDHVARGGTVCAHNAGFERTMWNVNLRATRECAGWPRLEIRQQDCTMARALAMHLPPDLDTLGEVLGVVSKKDRAGHALMMRMARPRKLYGPQVVIDKSSFHPMELTTRPDGGTAVWWTTPENIAREGAYCDRDVEAETEIATRVLPLSADERELWIRDQEINDRGVCLDVATIERAVAVRDVAVRRANERVAALTGGAVRRITETARIVSWLRGRSIACESIAKGEQDDLLMVVGAVGDDVARDVLMVRNEATKTSTAKFEKMLATVCADGRARGLFSYHRALTGRWGGAAVQPQNLPRVDEDEDLPDVLAAIQTMEMFG